MALEMLVGLNVTDDAKYQQYRDHMSPILLEYGGRFGYDFRVSEVLRAEIDAPINRVFTIRFPDKQVMDAFFKDDKYLEAKTTYYDSSVDKTHILATYDTED
ncbi:MAG: DUF1330 domain-containing protein [Chloroflexota bacterium]